MKNAFTLIELIIVITILIIITAVGVGAYSGIRRTLLIDLQADTLVTILGNMQSEVKNAPRCVGIRFEQDKAPQRIEAAYSSGTRTCGQVALVSSFALPAELRVAQVRADLAPTKTLSILFTPPHATVSLQPGSSLGDIIVALKNDAKRYRTVRVHKATGVIEKIK